jgi:lipopolysaccharide export system protein LptA
VTRYESAPGGWRVRLWQNKDVIEARTVVLEREERRLTAQGEVTTVFTESSPGATAAPVATPAPADERPSRPIFISADSLVYTDADRRAHYERRVLLRREASTIKSAALDTYLLPADEVKPGQSRLERALARGAVQIMETSPRGKRRGAAEMAEYVSAEDKMVLSGGEPYIFDEQRGYTRGRQLTYYVRDDRIFVHGDNVARTVTEQRVTKRR